MAGKDKVVKTVEIQITGKKFDSIANKLQTALNKIPESLSKLQSQMNASFTSLADTLGKNFADRLSKSIGRNLTGISTKNTVGVFSQSIITKLRNEMIRGGMNPKEITEKSILKEIGARASYTPATRMKKAEQYLQYRREARLYQRAIAPKVSNTDLVAQQERLQNQREKLQSQFDALQYKTRKFVFKNMGIKYSKDEMDAIVGVPSTSDLKTRMSAYKKELSKLQGEVIFKEAKKKISPITLPKSMGGSTITGVSLASPMKYSLMDIIGPQLKANQMSIILGARQQQENLLKTQQGLGVKQIEDLIGINRPKIEYDKNKSPFAQSSFIPFGDKLDFISKMELKDRQFQKPVEEYAKQLSRGLESAIKKEKVVAEPSLVFGKVSKLWEQLNNFNPYSVYPEKMQKMIENVKYDYEKEGAKTSPAANKRGGFINPAAIMQVMRAGTLGVLGAGGYTIGAAKNIKSIDFGTPNFQGPSKELIQEWKENISGINEGILDLTSGIIGAASSAIEKFFDIIKTGIGLLTTVTGLIAGAGYQMKQWGSDILITTERFRGYNIAMLGTLKTQSTVDEVMKTSMKIAEVLPIGYEQVFQGTKAMTLISPLKQMFKDTQNLESNMKDVWDIVIALSQIEPEWGIQGALYSLRETLSGDFMSIKRRYEIPVDIMMTVDGKPLSEIKKDPVKLLGGLSMNLRDLVPASTLEMTSKQFGPVMQKIQGFFDLLKTKIGESGFYDLFVGDMQKIQSDFGSFMNSFDSTVFAQRMSNAFSSAWKSFKSFVDDVVSYVNRIFGSNLKIDTSSISNTIAGITEELIKVFQLVEGLTSSKTLQNLIFNSFGELYKKLEYIVNVLSTVIPPILDSIADIISDISKGVGEVRNYTKGWISDSTLIKGLIFGWLFGFQNIAGVLGGIGKIIFNLVPSFSTLSFIVGNLYATFQLIMNSNDLFITGTYKLLINATSIGGTFSSIASTIGGALVNGLISVSSILLGMLATVGGLYGTFIILPNVIYAMMKTFDIFPNTAFGRFVDWMKDKTEMGTPSVTYRVEKAESQYSNIMTKDQTSDFPRQLSSLISALKEKGMEIPNTLSGFLGSMQRNKNFNQTVSTELTQLTAKGNNPAAKQLKELIAEFPGVTFEDTYQGMIEQQKKIGDSAEKSVEIFGNTFSEHLKFVFSPNFAPHKALLSSIEEFGKTLMGKVKDAILPSGSSGPNVQSYNLPTQNNPEISFNRYSESNLSRMSNVMKEMNDVFGTALKITSGSELLNRKGEFKHSKTSLHPPGLAFDVENLPLKMLEDRMTYQKLNEIAQRNELPRIRLPYALKSNKKIQSTIDDLTKEIPDFRIDFEPNTPHQTGTVTHFELPGFSQGRKSDYWRTELDRIKAEAESKITETPIFTKEAVTKNLENALHQIQNDVDTVFKETNLQVAKYGNLITLKDQTQEFWSKFVDVNTKIGESYYNQQIMEIESQKEVLRGTAKKTIKSEAFLNASKSLSNLNLDNIIPVVMGAEKISNTSDMFGNFGGIFKQLKTIARSTPGIELLTSGLDISDKDIEKKIKDTEKLRLADEALNKGRENALKNTQLRSREIFNTSARAMKEVYQSIGDFGVNVVGGNVALAFEEIVQQTVNTADRLFPTLTEKLAAQMTEIRKIQNIQGISFIDAMELQMAKLASDLNNYGLNPEKFANTVRLIEVLKLTYDKAQKLSPFKGWQEDVKDLKAEIKSVDFKSAMALNVIRAKLPQMSRSEKSDYYSAELAGLEFSTRGPRDSLRLGMESATVEFKNWSEQFFDAGKTLVDGLASTFETGFFDFMTGKLGNLNDMFRSIGRSILNTIGQIVSKMAALSVTKIVLGMDVNMGGGSFVDQVASGLLGTILGGGRSSGGIGPNTVAVEEPGFIGTLVNAGMNYLGISSGGGGSSGGAAAGAAAGAAGGFLGGVFGKGGSLSTAWKDIKDFALGPQGWIIPAAAGAMFLSQPGRLWGGTKSTKSLERAQANYGDATQFVNDITKRRLSDSEKYMYSGEYRGISSYSLSGPTLRTWPSGDGWFKGPKEKHGAIDYTEQDRTLKGYYKLLEVSAEEDYLQRKKLNELRKTNEYEALKQEIGIRQGYLKMIEEQFATAVSLNQFEKQDELRDKIYEMKTNIDELLDQTKEAFKAMSDAMSELKKKMVSDVVNLYSMEHLNSRGTFTYKEKPENLLSGITYYSNIRDLLLPSKNTGSGYLQDINIIKKLKEYATGTKDEFSIENTGYVFEKLNDLVPYLSDYYKTMDVAGERVLVSRDVVDEMGRFITIGPEHYEWKVDKAKVKEKLAGYEEALTAKLTLENTIGTTDYNISNLFSDNNSISEVFKNIKIQNETILALGESAKTDLIYGGAQAIADANLKISEYYKQVANQLQSWVDAGLLGKYVLKINNLSQDAFDSLAGVAREVGFRSSLTQSFKGFETMKELQNVLSQTISVGGSEQMKTFAGITSSFSDPFDAYFNLQQELISNRIGSAENGSEKYYQAQMDLFSLMAERAEHLKAKSEDSMRKLEELLDNIDQTMKLRIAEEAKTSKGDVVFLDLRTYSDMASEISKAIKNNDPQAMDLVDRLRKKLAGTSV